VEVPDAENFPSPAEPTGEAWHRALEDLDETHEALRQAVLRLEDAHLDRQVTSGEETYSIYFLLHGAVQHCLYHAGQIQVLKSAIGSLSSV